MNKDHIYYVAYMLRLWLEDGQEFGRALQSQGEWRASLEDPHTQEVRYFEKLDDLYEFLEDQLESAAQQLSSDHD